MEGMMEAAKQFAGNFGQGYFTAGGTYGKCDSQAAGVAQLSRWYAGIVRPLRTIGIDIFTPQRTVTEIGCEYGPLLELYGETNTAIVGTDLSMCALSEIRRSCTTCPLAAAQPTSMPFGSGTGGTVFAFEVLEHFDAPQQSLEQMYRVTRTGELVVATTPNPLGKILPGIDSNSDPTNISVLPPEQWYWRTMAARFLSPEVLTPFQVPYVWRQSRALSMAVRLPVIGPVCVVVARS